MPKSLPMSVIHQNIYEQLQASRMILETIPELAEVARVQENPKEKETLERLMKRLLDIGETLSEEASATGRKVLDFMGADT